MSERNTATAPIRAFHIMTKPTGAICNLDCKYCYFLSKEMMYPGSRFRSSQLVRLEVAEHQVEVK
jgi:uncharacterized protein